MTEMIKEKKETDRRLIMLAITALFFFLMHLTFVGFTNDDYYFRIMKADHGSVLQTVIYRYQTDTSRVLSEALLFCFIELPFIIWQIADTLICVLTAYASSVIFGLKKDDKRNYLIFLLFACYPYMHMGSAGWICTTLNYIWPLAAFLYGLSVVMRRYRNEKVSGNTYRFALICLLFAVNCEQSAAVVTFAFILASVFAILDKKNAWYEITGACIGIFGIVFALTSPGNGARTEMEAANWMPQFFDLTLIEKARLCGVFVFEHFVMVPCVIFALFTAVLMFAGFEKAKETSDKKKLLYFTSAVPAVIDVVFTSMYFVKDFIIGHKRNYDFTFPPVYMDNPREVFVQLSEIAALIIYIAAACYTLWRIFPEVRQKICAIYMLGVGFAVRMALMLSPTMFASWHRVMIFLYFAFLGDSYLLIDLLLKRKKKWQKIVIILIIAAGIIANLILTVGLQIRKRGM